MNFRFMGFGISTPDHVRALKGYGEGLIVGSAIVKRMAAQADADTMICSVAAFVSELKQALR